jgi:hypothetical protein
MKPENFRVYVSGKQSSKSLALRQRIELWGKQRLSPGKILYGENGVYKRYNLFQPDLMK